MPTATALYIKSTNHLFSSFTRNSSNASEITGERIVALYPQFASIRGMRQSTLKPQKLDSGSHVAVPNGESPNLYRAKHAVHIQSDEIGVFNEDAESPLQNFVTAPNEFALKEEKIAVIANSPVEFPLHATEGLAYSLRSDGLQLKITPTAQTTINRELAVSVIYRHEAEKQFFIFHSMFNKKSQEGRAAEAKVTFPITSTQTSHFIVVLIDGFRAIWDELPLETDSLKWTRRWVP